jgi:cardiolipin synthase A/B
VNGPWREGNSVQLLENGEEYYPALLDAISRARYEVLIETFILFDDPVGRQLRERLTEAARRGVHCHLLLDGYGSPRLSDEFVGEMIALGVEIHYFDPVKRYFGKSVKVFRRMHRKLVVIDGREAFCGGINLSQEHLRTFGELSKQDYMVRLSGPVVADIRSFMRSFPNAAHRASSVADTAGQNQAKSEHPPGDSQVRFIVRDNHACKTMIESAYLAAIRSARERVVIANAYFFPSYRVLKELRDAAARGVDVKLILQGRPDMQFVQRASRMVYRFLVRGKVSVYEYCERPLHAKVALVDREWATVGSSNLDPLSLSLNLEANVLILDRDFNANLMRSMQRLLEESCRRVDPASFPRRTRLQFLLGRLAFHLLRRFPAWFDLLPAHTIHLAPAVARSDEDSKPDQHTAAASHSAGGKDGASAGRTPSDRG